MFKSISISSRKETNLADLKYFAFLDLLLPLPPVYKLSDSMLLFISSAVVCNNVYNLELKLIKI